MKFLAMGKQEAKDDYGFPDRTVWVLKSRRQGVWEGNNVIPITLGPCGKLMREMKKTLVQAYYPGRDGNADTGPN